ncbi:MAG: type II secretion system protein [Candidatus Blackburnbacteria bacterium]|nr:type II secretion system protein [Candidatus Blackburnbacteria bacterium]
MLRLTTFLRNGFTIIELVIAIGFLAILVSMALFVTDPFEGVRLKRDSNLSKDAETIVEGINNFYIARGKLPWSSNLNSRDNANPFSWHKTTNVEVGICENEDCSKPGILVTEGLIPSGLPSQHISADKSDAIYLGKGQGSQSPVYACFVPTSETERKKTGELYKININTNFPLTGALESCPSTVTWEDEDVCYVCVAK